jgi:hypothetical protein
MTDWSLDIIGEEEHDRLFTGTEGVFIQPTWARDAG